MLVTQTPAVTPLTLQTTLVPHVGVEAVTIDHANQLLVAWGHYLGACNRPFGQQAYALHVDGRPVSVAVTASTVSATITDETGRTYQRGDVVELARLCSAEPWATRVMLRLWREACATSWPHWRPLAAVAYSQSSRHDGRVYRFDGWTPVRDDAGQTGGGGAWGRPRYATAAARGRKTLWIRKTREYTHEYASEAEHRQLAEVLRATPAAVLLSGYPSPLYDELYAGWQRLERRVHRPSSNAGRGERRHAVEVVWSNRALPVQQRLAFQEATG